METTMSVVETSVTKKCSRCGRILPVEQFYKKIASVDGLQGYCKECANSYPRKAKGEGAKMKKVFSSPELAKFTPRQLIDELKMRGYRGTLTIQQQVVL